MTNIASTLRLPAEEKRLAETLSPVFELSASVWNFFHRRWVYRSMIAKLEGYSERTLQDIGAEFGIEEFARRAARL